MSEYDDLLGRFGALGLHEVIQSDLNDAAQAIRTLSKERDMAVEALGRIGWHELTWNEARDVARATLAQLEASKGEG